MPSYVLRVWIPDRPGALGSVASRIGAVRGDVVGIDILERGGGRAIDELVIFLPDENLVPLLVNEVSQVDGVDVEDVAPCDDPRNPHLDALETAAALVAEATVEGLLSTLVTHTHRDFDADWVVIVDLETSTLRVSVGSPPSLAWLAAFLSGSRSSMRVAAGEYGPDDMALAHFTTVELALVVSREGRPFRARERRQVAVLARIVDHLLCRSLGKHGVSPSHPVARGADEELSSG